MNQTPLYLDRINWLRAAVLGANDGILSTASIAIGVAAASDTRYPIVLAALAGLVAGALSMAAGEYVSVSSQLDSEAGILKRTSQELESNPKSKIEALAKIYQKRGLDEVLSLEIAQKLSSHDALDAHAREEFGLHERTMANPLQAALASGMSFIAGGSLPLLVSIFMPLKNMVYLQYGFAISFLMLLGYISAKLGGGPIIKSVMRITFWGTIAMGVTALVGYLFNLNL